jgi:21S rRNA (uridine2791-2'-O)-methyltransferase
MLSRRFLRELTNRFLLGSGYKPAAGPCLVAPCPPSRPRSESVKSSVRYASSSSSTRWKSRQGKDFFAREARVQGLKSRAAFKLLEVGANQCLQGLVC